MLNKFFLLSIAVLFYSGCVLLENIEKPPVPNYESIKSQKGNKSEAYSSKLMISYNPREKVPGKNSTYQSLKMGRNGKPYPAVDRQFWDPIFGRSGKAGSTYGGWVTMNNMKYGMLAGGAICLVAGGILYAVNPPATHTYGYYTVTTVPVGAIGAMIGGGICVIASIFINPPEDWLKQAVNEYNDYIKKDLRITLDKSSPLNNCIISRPWCDGNENNFNLVLMALEFQ